MNENGAQVQALVDLLILVPIQGEGQWRMTTKYDVVVE